MLRPRSNFSRSSSRIFRMDNLSCAIDPRPLRTKGRTIASVTPASAAAWDHLKEGPACRGIPGRHGAESGAGMRRNQGPASGGIRNDMRYVRLAPWQTEVSNVSRLLGITQVEYPQYLGRMPSRDAPYHVSDARRTIPEALVGVMPAIDQRRLRSEDLGYEP